MRIKTFTASSTSKLDRKVNEFLDRQDVAVRKLHATMSFGTYMIVIEYEGQLPHS